MRFEDYLSENEKDPEYHEAMEDLRIHFDFGRAMLTARINNGWSQSKLAKLVGTKQANISRIEAGQGNPTMDLMQRIAKVIGIEIVFTKPKDPMKVFKISSTEVINSSFQPIPCDNWPVRNKSNINSTATEYIKA